MAKAIDWDAVERDYRTDKYTLRELSARYNISHAQIGRRAKDRGWVKDLRDAIKRATDAALLQDSVTSAIQNVTETILIEAEVRKNIILDHREGLRKLSELKLKLMSHIEQTVEHMSDLSDVIEMVRSPNDNGVDRANDELRKALSRSSLVDDLKKLSDVDEKVRRGEREAFRLDDTPLDQGKSVTVNVSSSIKYDDIIDGP